MKSFDGYLKLKLGNNYVLLAGGGHKSVNDFAINGHTHSYLPLSGGTMGGTAWIKWSDSGNLNNSNNGVTFPVTRGGLQWSGLSDYVKLFSEETGRDNLDLVLQFGDDNSNGLSIRNTSGNLTAFISASGNISASEFIKSGSSNSYILLGGGGHKALSDFSMAHNHPYLPLSGGTMTGNLILKGGTSANMTYAGNVHPYIRFDNSDSSQNVSLIFTDYDSYRAPAGLKLVGSQGNEWFEAAGIISKWAFINTGDSTLKVYDGKITDGKSDGNICLQTSIDGTDGQSHEYPTKHGSRCNLVLQPRGGQVYIGTNPDSGNTNYKLYVNGNVYASSFTGNASSATKLTSSAGSAALPIYFSDGKPVVCTAASVFSNLSNSGNNISITVAGQNRTLTVGYADTVDGYHASSFIKKHIEYDFSSNGTAPYNYVWLCRIGNSRGHSGMAITFDVNSRYHKHYQINMLISTGQYAYSSSTISINKSDSAPNVYYVRTANTSDVGYDYFDIYVVCGAWNYGGYKIINTNESGELQFTNKCTLVDSIPSGATAVGLMYSGNYKTLQTAVSNPTALGTSTTFIDTISLNTNGVITVTKKTVPTMSGATASTAGTIGMVPAPAINLRTLFLKGDGTWATPSDTHWTTHLYIGAKDKASNAATTNGNTYIKVTDNSTIRNQYIIKGVGRTTVASDADGNIIITSPTVTWSEISDKPSTFAPSTHNHPTSQINTLTNYTKATVAAALATTDSLNTALGKLEYKLDIAYDLVTKANDSDGTIENLKEILDVLAGIKDTETIKAIIGKYLPLSGGTMTLGEGLKFHADNNYFGTNSDARIISLLDSNGTTCDGGLIIDERCTNNDTTTITELLRIRDAEFKWKGLNILHAGNSNIKNGVITINGTSITPLTSHQSLANYVTLNTSLTISGVKTFSTQLKFTVAQGTSPFTVTSNTKVTNLNADLLDGYHASNIYRAPSFTTNNSNTSNTYLLIATITINGTSLGCAEFTTLFQNRECLDSSSFILSCAIRRSSTSSVSATLSYTTLHTSTPRNIYLRSDDGVTFRVYIQSATNTYTTYYRAVPLLDSGNVTYSNTGTTSPISGSVINVTATKGGNVYYANSAATASKLGTSTIGGTTTPIYLNAGVPTACTSYANASVNYANTSGAISNLSSSDNALSTGTWRKIWISYDNGTTGRPALSDSLTFQTSTGTLKAPIFQGNLKGNADTATNADTVDGIHADKFPYINNNGKWRVYGNSAAAALADNTAGLSAWAFGETRNKNISYLGILKPSAATCGIVAHGTIAVFGQGDTHMGIAVDYSSANFQVFGGNADKIVWRKKVAFTDSNVASATKLTSSAGSASLPIYFSDGKPTVCTPASIFSNLSNNGQALSITVAGQNRTLTVAYANNTATAARLKIYTEVSNNTNVYRVIGQQTLNSKWTNKGLVLAVASRHSGVGIYTIHYGAEVSNGYYADRNLSNTDSYYTFANVYCKIRYFGDTHDTSNSKIICHVKPASGENPKSAVFTFFLHSNDYSSPRISILQDWGSPFELIENGATMSTIDTSVYGELKESTVMNESNSCTGNSATASYATNADKLDGYHFSDLENRYVNVTGDTMTGDLTITGINFLDTDGLKPVLKIGSSNKDTTIWRVYSNEVSYGLNSSIYGYSLKYLGTGSGNNNKLVLIADNLTGTRVTAISITQDGVVTLNKIPTVNGTAVSLNGHTHSQYLTTHLTIYGLTIQANGTSLGTYTPNSAAKTFNITYANVGAAAASHTHNYAGSSSAGGAANSANVLNSNSRMDYGWNGVNYFNASMTAGCKAKTNDSPTSAWWHIMRFNHANNNGYYTDLAIPFNNNSLYWKCVRNGSLANTSWVKVLDSLNYNEYAPTKTGGGASGTWGISISGNAATATKLLTARTIWGLSFNGSANVSGNMSSVGQITFSNLSGTNGRALLYQLMADNDFFRIYVGGTASDAGYAEIATADGGNEPIYVRQYTGTFSTLVRTLTLLDTKGNTTFPGTASASGFIKSGSNDNYILLGGGGHKAVSDFSTSGHTHDGRYMRVYLESNVVPASTNGYWSAMTTQSGISGDWWHIIHTDWNGAASWRSELALPTQGRNGIRYRSDSNGESGWAFGSWVKLLDENNWSNYCAAASHSHSYLPLSGGTLTGALTIKNNNWNNILILNRTSASGTWGPSIIFQYDGTTNGTLTMTSNLLYIGDNGSNRHKAWHEGNDGSGSGLDADTIDGKHASAFALSSHTHSYLPLAGGTMTGNITYKAKGTSYIGNGANDAAYGVGGALNNLVISSWYGISFTTSCSGLTYTGTNAVSINCRNGYVYANTFVGTLSGNATSATKLATARSIFGKSFNGTANVSGQGLFYGTYTSSANARYSKSGLLIRENDLVQDNLSDIGYAPSIGFHWGSKAAATMLLHSDGNFYFRKIDGVTRASLDANIIGNAATATNADKVDGYHASSFALQSAHNDLIAAGNEFTFVPSGFNNSVYFNYRTKGGTNGNITSYIFGNGKGGALGIALHTGNYTSYCAPASHTHLVKINGSTKTITATGGTAVNLGSYLSLAGGTMDADARISFNDNGNLYIGTEDSSGYVYFQDIASLEGTDCWYITLLGSASFNVDVTAPTFYGNLEGNASSATRASKLGSSTVGSGTRHFYLNAGTATASSSTVGNADKPMYLNNGTMTACSSSLTDYLPLTGGLLTGDLYIERATDASFWATYLNKTIIRMVARPCAAFIQCGNYSWTGNVPMCISGPDGTEGSTLRLKFSTVDASGNILASHFYENSDIRYKRILKNLLINSNTIANLPLFDFEWIENNTIGTGTSALAVLLILPNIVSGNEKLTLNYGVLGTIAGITACKELVKVNIEIFTLKSELLQLKEKVKLLEDKLCKYENV